MKRLEAPFATLIYFWSTSAIRRLNFLYVQSVSAFAPIVNPISCPWGQKVFTNYLGENKAGWEVSYSRTKKNRHLWSSVD